MPPLGLLSKYKVRYEMPLWFARGLRGKLSFNVPLFLNFRLCPQLTKSVRLRDTTSAFRVVFTNFEENKIFPAAFCLGYNFGVRDAFGDYTAYAPYIWNYVVKLDVDSLDIDQFRLVIYYDPTGPINQKIYSLIRNGHLVFPDFYKAIINSGFLEDFSVDSDLKVDSFKLIDPITKRNIVGTKDEALFYIATEDTPSGCGIRVREQSPEWSEFDQYKSLTDALRHSALFEYIGAVQYRSYVNEHYFPEPNFPPEWEPYLYQYKEKLGTDRYCVSHVTLGGGYELDPKVKEENPYSEDKLQSRVYFEGFWGSSYLSVGSISEIRDPNTTIRHAILGAGGPNKVGNPLYSVNVDSSEIFEPITVNYSGTDNKTIDAPIIHREFLKSHIGGIENYLSEVSALDVSLIFPLLKDNFQIQEFIRLLFWAKLATFGMGGPGYIVAGDSAFWNSMYRFRMKISKIKLERLGNSYNLIIEIPPHIVNAITSPYRSRMCFSDSSGIIICPFSVIVWDKEAGKGVVSVNVSNFPRNKDLYLYYDDDPAGKNDKSYEGYPREDNPATQEVEILWFFDCQSGPVYDVGALKQYHLASYGDVTFYIQDERLISGRVASLNGGYFYRNTAPEYLPLGSNRVLSYDIAFSASVFTPGKLAALLIPGNYFGALYLRGITESTAHVVLIFGTTEYNLTTITVKTGEWYHLAVVIEEGAERLYTRIFINAKCVYNSEINKETYYPNSIVLIGRDPYYGSGDNAFYGRIFSALVTRNSLSFDSIYGRYKLTVNLTPESEFDDDDEPYDTDPDPEDGIDKVFTSKILSQPPEISDVLISVYGDPWQPPWVDGWLPGFRYRMKIEYTPPITLSQDIENFQLFLTLPVEVINILGSTQNAKKIAFTGSDNLNQTYAEIIEFNEEAKRFSVFVLVPRIISYGKTALYLYFDDQAYDNDSFIGFPLSESAKKVWKGFNYVIHPGTISGVSIYNAVDGEKVGDIFPGYHLEYSDKLRTLYLTDDSQGYLGDEDVFGSYYLDIVSTSYNFLSSFPPEAFSTNNPYSPFNYLCFTQDYGSYYFSRKNDTEFYDTELPFYTFNGWSSSNLYSFTLRFSQLPRPKEFPNLFYYNLFGHTLGAQNQIAYFDPEGNQVAFPFHLSASSIILDPAIVQNSHFLNSPCVLGEVSSIVFGPFIIDKPIMLPPGDWISGPDYAIPILVSPGNYGTATDFHLRIDIQSSIFELIPLEMRASAYKSITVTASDKQTQLPVFLEFWDVNRSRGAIHVKLSQFGGSSSLLYLYLGKNYVNQNLITDKTSSAAVNFWSIGGTDPLAILLFDDGCNTSETIQSISYHDPFKLFTKEGFTSSDKFEFDSSANCFYLKTSEGRLRSYSNDVLSKWNSSLLTVSSMVSGYALTPIRLSYDDSNYKSTRVTFDGAVASYVVGGNSYDYSVSLSVADEQNPYNILRPVVGTLNNPTQKCFTYNYDTKQILSGTITCGPTSYSYTFRFICLFTNTTSLPFTERLYTARCYLSGLSDSYSKYFIENYIRPSGYFSYGDIVNVPKVYHSLGNVTNVLLGQPIFGIPSIATAEEGHINYLECAPSTTTLKPVFGNTYIDDYSWAQGMQYRAKIVTNNSGCPFVKLPSSILDGYGPNDASKFFATNRPFLVTFDPENDLCVFYGDKLSSFTLYYGPESTNTNVYPFYPDTYDRAGLMMFYDNVIRLFGSDWATKPVYNPETQTWEWVPKNYTISSNSVSFQRSGDLSGMAFNGTSSYVDVTYSDEDGYLGSSAILFNFNSLNSGLNTLLADKDSQARIGIDGSTGKIRIIAPYDNVLLGNSLSQEVWHYVTIIPGMPPYGGTQIYIDGVYIDTIGWGATYFSGFQGYVLGSNLSKDGEFFNGIIQGIHAAEYDSSFCVTDSYIDMTPIDLISPQEILTGVPIVQLTEFVTIDFLTLDVATRGPLLGAPMNRDLSLNILDPSSILSPSVVFTSPSIGASNSLGTEDMLVPSILFSFAILHMVFHLNTHDVETGDPTIDQPFIDSGPPSTLFPSWIITQKHSFSDVIVRGVDSLAWPSGVLLSAPNFSPASCSLIFYLSPSLVPIGYAEAGSPYFRAVSILHSSSILVAFLLSSSVSVRTPENLTSRSILGGGYIIDRPNLSDVISKRRLLAVSRVFKVKIEKGEGRWHT